MTPTPEFMQVGAWLLTETYGNAYDHFTQTSMATKPGVCVAVYAKTGDLIGTPAEYRLSRDGSAVSSPPTPTREQVEKAVATVLYSDAVVDRAGLIADALIERGWLAVSLGASPTTETETRNG